MKQVLVVHALNRRMRLTTVDFVMSFMRYPPEDTQFTYHNITRPIGRSLEGRRFDGLILPYDVLSYRQAPFWGAVLEALKPLADLAETVVALPQDDYTHNGVLDDCFYELGAETIFTPIETGLDVIYPKMSRIATIKPALTGYVDEGSVHRRDRFRIPMSVRERDVGQRVRMLPAWFGRGGLEKGLFAEAFSKKATGSSLKVDISTKDSDTFHGDDWYRFLATSKATIGQKGGASMCDPDGSIMRAVMEYTSENSGARFDEIEANCFPGLDGKVIMKAISPRLFDAAILHTAQILKEDDYLGVFEPWAHYIPTDHELTNFDEIESALSDNELLTKMTQAADEALIESGLFTYRAFVRSVSEAIGDSGKESSHVLRSDLADRLQWRLTPQLFEGVQRLAQLGNMADATGSVLRLADKIRRVTVEDPSLLPYLDIDLLQALIGDVELDGALDTMAGPIVDILVECAAAGALRDVSTWLRHVEDTSLQRWQFLDWIDADTIELDRATG